MHALSHSTVFKKFLINGLDSFAENPELTDNRVASCVKLQLQKT